MIFDEDLEQKTKKSKPKNLYDMSIGELKDYVESLNAEISRVEEEIAKKEKHKASMDSLFGARN